MKCPICNIEIEAPCYMGPRYYYNGMVLFACGRLKENEIVLVDCKHSVFDVRRAIDDLGVGVTDLMRAPSKPTEEK